MSASCGWRWKAWQCKKVRQQIKFTCNHEQITQFILPSILPTRCEMRSISNLELIKYQHYVNKTPHRGVKCGALTVGSASSLRTSFKACGVGQMVRGRRDLSPSTQRGIGSLPCLYLVIPEQWAGHVGVRLSLHLCSFNQFINTGIRVLGSLWVLGVLFGVHIVLPCC